MSATLPSSTQPSPGPTLLESQLDSICLMLSQMKSRVHRIPMQEHLSDAERAQLEAALMRVEAKMTELGDLIRHVS